MKLIEVAIQNVDYRDCPYWTTRMAMQGEEDLEIEEYCELGHICSKAYDEDCPEWDEEEKECQ